eukprot:scaffold74378_cov71-Phaeocystis_antarctica.AAC.3
MLHSAEASGLLGLALLGLARDGGLVVDRVADGGLLRVSPAVQLLRDALPEDDVDVAEERAERDDEAEDDCGVDVDVQHAEGDGGDEQVRADVGDGERGGRHDAQREQLREEAHAAERRDAAGRGDELAELAVRDGPGHDEGHGEDLEPEEEGERAELLAEVADDRVQRHVLGARGEQRDAHRGDAHRGLLVGGALGPLDVAEGAVEHDAHAAGDGEHEQVLPRQQHAAAVARLDDRGDHRREGGHALLQRHGEQRDGDVGAREVDGDEEARGDERRDHLVAQRVEGGREEGEDGQDPDDRDRARDGREGHGDAGHVVEHRLGDDGLDRGHADEQHDDRDELQAGGARAQVLGAAARQAGGEDHADVEGLLGRAPPVVRVAAGALLLRDLGGARVPLEAQVRGEGEEDRAHAEALQAVEHVLEVDDGDERGDDLPHVGDGGEGERAVGADRVEHEELAERAEDGYDDDVLHDRRVVDDEGARADDLERGEGAGDAEEEREDARPQHHWPDGEAVLFEHRRLPVGGEGVGEDVDEQQHDAAEGGRGLPRRVGALRLVVVVEQEEEGAHEHEHGRGVLEALVRLVVHDVAEQHHGGHLARLGEHEQREGDVVEREVLCHARDQVGVRTYRVLVDRRRAEHVGARHDDERQDGEHEGGEAVAQREEGAVLEGVAALEGACHRTLLVEAQRDMARHDPNHAEAEVERRLPEGRLCLGLLRCLAFRRERAVVVFGMLSRLRLRLSSRTPHVGQFIRDNREREAAVALDEARQHGSREAVLALGGQR